MPRAIFVMQKLRRIPYVRINPGLATAKILLLKNLRLFELVLLSGQKR